MSIIDPKQLTSSDVTRLEASIKRLIKITKQQQPDPEYFDLLKQVVEAVRELKLIVEFDHEKRLQAIEEYLQQI